MAWLLYGSKSSKSNILCISAQHQAGSALTRLFLTRAVLGKSVVEFSALQKALPSLSTDGTGAAWLNNCSDSTLMGKKKKQNNKRGPSINLDSLSYLGDAFIEGVTLHFRVASRHTVPF